MAKNGCGQFIELATLYSNDGLQPNQISHYALKASDKRYKVYTAKVKSSVKSKSQFTEYQEGCECAANYKADLNSTYNSDANSTISAEVDQYGSIIIKNSLRSQANTNGSINETDNTALLYCAPDPSIYTFNQNGSINCTNNDGRTLEECKGQCTTTETRTVLVKEENKWKKTTETYSSDLLCLFPPSYSPGDNEYVQDNDTETDQSYSKNEIHNHQWQSDVDCSSGSYNYKSTSKINISVSEEVDLSTAQGIRRQAINKRLDIYEKNGPQNKDGANCKNHLISPDEYDCWDFYGVDFDNLYVEEELYSWKVRVKAFVYKVGLPVDVTTFKANVHVYAIPALFDEYGDPYPHPEYEGSNCTCGSEIGPINNPILPFKKLEVSVPRDGTIVTWRNTELIVGSSGDIDSSEAPIQISYGFYCVQDTTFL